MEEFRALAEGLPRLIFGIGAGSVQRPCDWVGCRWGDHDGASPDAMAEQDGQGEPCTDPLKVALRLVPIAVRPIAIKPDGDPIRYRYMADLMLKERKRLGLAADDPSRAALSQCDGTGMGWL